MLLVSGAILLASLFGTALPIVTARAIDRIGDSAATQMGGFVVLIATIFVLHGLSWTLNAVRRTIGAKAIGNVVLRLRVAAFEALMGHDLSFYDVHPTGKVVSRVTSDTQALSDIVTLTMELVSQFTLVVLVLGYLFTVNSTLAAMTLVLVPVVVAVALSFRRIARDTVTQARRAVAEVTGHVHETISGITVAKSFGKEQVLYQEFGAVNERSFRHGWRSGVVFSSIFPLLFSIAGLATGGLAYLGSLRVTGGAMSLGDWYLFLQGIGLLWFPLTSIASFWSQLQLGLAASERVFALLDADPAVTQVTSEGVAAVAGRIRLEDVSFHYKEGEPVLERFSLEIEPGETLALVGHTGSGKSSITKLIARFYEYQAGRIEIDGRDVRTLDLAAYRSKLGFVTQVPFLFDGTVMDNIRYGRLEHDDASVAAVAARVGGGDWLRSLADGLDTEVAERGRGLSMGQRQLVSLARVLLQNPAVVILDEATASVDPLTETLIQEGLEELLAERTAIVIAHRLSTIRSADRILVLREGQTIEEGSHDSLLATGGHYADLYNTYFRHQSIEYIESAPSA